MSDKLREFIEIPQQFVQDGNQFLTRCTKPSQKEFVQICKAVAVGFAVMGFIGYFVKLIHIPINNILVMKAVEELHPHLLYRIYTGFNRPSAQTQTSE
ncbi:protein translocase SEC6 [Lentinula detonsa]|uniref:Protein translocase SEC6 n=1 Tax=Lentinula detonsa TaxID=2804962 RepID=A0AA38Q091_9AGAR|nr:protein translocase SEC6 [Lentinula detonsa]